MDSYQTQTIAVNAKIAAKTKELWLQDAKHAMALFKKFGGTQIQHNMGYKAKERQQGGTESAHHSNYDYFSAKHRDRGNVLSQNIITFKTI